LKSTSGASRELAQALEALGKNPADAARTARVEQRLGALLDVTPAASQAAWLQHVLLKSVAAKLLAVGLLTAVGASWLFGSSPPAQPVAVPGTVEAPAVAPSPPPEVHVAPGALPAPSIEPESSVALAHEETKLQPQAVRHPGKLQSVGTRTRADAAARPRTGAAPLAVTSTSSFEGSGAEAPAFTDTVPASESAPARAPDAQAKPPVARPEPPAPPPTPPSETSLLLSARKQLRAAPADALVLLDEHATLFPRGLLAPEREVLAIEALRKLGRHGDADQRLARFRVQYPDSPFLRGLR
jgi:hypothetical protein